MSGPFGSSQWMYKLLDYEIDNSLMFEWILPSLTRTPGTAGNRKTFTYSAWVKRTWTFTSFNDVSSARCW